MFFRLTVAKMLATSNNSAKISHKNRKRGRELGLSRQRGNFSILRVLMILGSLELGGAERQALRLALYLRDMCHYTVSFIGFSKPGRFSALAEEAGFACRAAEHPFGHKSPNLALLNFTLELYRCKPDCLISFTSSPNVYSALVWRIIGAKACIWGQRDACIYSDILHAYSETMRKVSALTANSPAGACVLEQFGVSTDAVHIIPNGVTLPPARMSREEWRKKLGIPPDALVGCMLANLSSYKDHKTLLLAWHMAVRQNALPQEARLALAGREDEQAAYLHAFVKMHGLEDSVLFLGPVDDVAGLLQAVDIGLFSSRSEGLPNAVLEGMLAGLPFVASDIPGVGAALGKASENLLVPAGDAPAFCEALIRLFGDQALRSRAGRKNREEALRYTPERMGKQFAALIEQCCFQAEPCGLPARLWFLLCFLVADVLRPQHLPYDLWQSGQASVKVAVKTVVKGILGERNVARLRALMGSPNEPLS